METGQEGGEMRTGGLAPNNAKVLGEVDVR
jgi:hypothetical protein